MKDYMKSDSRAFNISIMASLFTIIILLILELVFEFVAAFIPSLTPWLSKIGVGIILIIIYLNLHKDWEANHRKR